VHRATSLAPLPDSAAESAATPDAQDGAPPVDEANEASTVWADTYEASASVSEGSADVSAPDSPEGTEAVDAADASGEGSEEGLASNNIDSGDADAAATCPDPGAADSSAAFGALVACHAADSGADAAATSWTEAGALEGGQQPESSQETEASTCPAGCFPWMGCTFQGAEQVCFPTGTCVMCPSGMSTLPCKPCPY
jgi:hypothetical protein